MTPTVPTALQAAPTPPTDGQPYRSPARQQNQPWGYLSATGVVESGTPLTITAWMHHGTAWITATGDLIQATAGTLDVFLSRVRDTARHGTVLNLCGLTDLDASGVRSIVTAHRVATGLRRHFDVIAAWNPAIPDGDSATPWRPVSPPARDRDFPPPGLVPLHDPSCR